MRIILLLLFGLFCMAHADAQSGLSAGSVQLLSDAAVSLMASPTLNLQPGQPVTFTIIVTNKGPVPIDRLVVVSSALFAEQIDLYPETTDCGFVLTSVTDAWPEPYYEVTWAPTRSTYTSGDDRPIAVGESRSCHITMTVALAAPPSFPIDFHLPSEWHDFDPLDDTGRVILQLAPIVEAAPVLSLPACLLLALGLLAAAGRRRLAGPLAGPAPNKIKSP